MINVKYQLVRKTSKLPTKATEEAGAYDVYVDKIEHISENKAKVYLGFKMQPPTGYRVRIVPRSSFTKYNYALSNSPCVGDSDYAGEYMLVFTAIPTGTDYKESDYYAGADKGYLPTKEWFLEYDEFPYQVGDRCGQLYFDQIIEPNFINQPLTVTDRVGGFGSTGK